MDFVEKRSSYLEKASHSIEKERFVVQNGVASPSYGISRGIYYIVIYLYVYIYIFRSYSFHIYVLHLHHIEIYKQ